MGGGVGGVSLKKRGIVRGVLQVRMRGRKRKRERERERLLGWMALEQSGACVVARWWWWGDLG